MKKSEHDKKLREVGQIVGESGLIRKCIRVATILGDAGQKMDRRNKHDHYRYEDSGLEIDYEDGRSTYGGGHVQVDYEGDVVFRVEKTRSDTAVPLVSADESRYVVRTYHTGDWERRVALLSRKIKKPVVKPEVKDPEISEDVRKAFEENFSL